MNGMVIPEMRAPNHLDHHRIRGRTDPRLVVPRPIASSACDQEIARAHRTAMRRAAYSRFTSAYLRDLIATSIRPARAPPPYSTMASLDQGLGRAALHTRAMRPDGRPTDGHSFASANVTRQAAGPGDQGLLPALLAYAGLEALTYSRHRHGPPAYIKRPATACRPPRRRRAVAL